MREARDRTVQDVFDALDAKIGRQARKAASVEIHRWRRDEHESAEHCLEAILAALSSAGLAVVPVEPTPEMRVAAVEAVAKQREPMIQKLREHDSPGWMVHSTYSSHESNEVWRAMITAALPPLASGGG